MHDIFSGSGLQPPSKCEVRLEPVAWSLYQVSLVPGLRFSRAGGSSVLLGTEWTNCFVMSRFLSKINEDWSCSPRSLKKKNRSNWSLGEQPFRAFWVGHIELVGACHLCWASLKLKEKILNHLAECSWHLCWFECFLLVAGQERELTTELCTQFTCSPGGKLHWCVPALSRTDPHRQHNYMTTTYSLKKEKKKI